MVPIGKDILDAMLSTPMDTIPEDVVLVPVSVPINIAVNKKKSIPSTHSLFVVFYCRCIRKNKKKIMHVFLLPKVVSRVPVQ